MVNGYHDSGVYRPAEINDEMTQKIIVFFFLIDILLTIALIETISLKTL